MSDFALYRQEEYITLICRDGKVYLYNREEKEIHQPDIFELNPNVPYDCFGDPIKPEDIKDQFLKEAIINLIII